MAVSTSDRSFRASDDDSFLLVMKGLRIAMMCQGVNVEGVEAYFCFDDRADEGIVREYIGN